MKKFQFYLLALFCVCTLNSANAFDSFDLVDEEDSLTTEESFSPAGSVTVSCNGFHRTLGITCCSAKGTGPNLAAAEGKARGECQRTNTCGSDAKISCYQD